MAPDDRRSPAPWTLRRKLELSFVVLALAFAGTIGWVAHLTATAQVSSERALEEHHELVVLVEARVAAERLVGVTTRTVVLGRETERPFDRDRPAAVESARVAAARVRAMDTATRSGEALSVDELRRVGAGLDGLVRASEEGLARVERGELSRDAAVERLAAELDRLDTILDDAIAAQSSDTSDLEATSAALLQTRLAVALVAVFVLVGLLAVGWSTIRTLEHAARVLSVLQREIVRKLGDADEDPAPVGLFELSTSVRGMEETVARTLDRLLAVQAARDEAIELSTAKSRFLANVSHELRTPLNAIIGYSELQLEEDPSSEENVGKILVAGHRLLELVNDVLDLAKIEAGHMTILAERCDLVELVADVLDTVSPMARERGNRTEAWVAPEVGLVWTDAHRLRQILTNLLSNACKYTDQGVIRVEARLRLAEIVITVEDTGIGIPASRLPTLFAPFVQAQHDARRDRLGTGLGLALSAEFARMLSGSLSATSVLGEGSTFTLVLPAVTPPRRSTSASIPPPRKGAEVPAVA